MSPLASPYNEDGTMKRVIKMPLDNTWVLTRDVAEGLEDSWLNENKGIGSYNTLFAEAKCPWIKGLTYRINVGLNYRTSKQGAFTGTGVGSDNADSPNSASVQQSYIQKLGCRKSYNLRQHLCREASCKRCRHVFC